MGTIRQWHWISGAITLVGMLLFAITGITLNHASAIPSEPVVVEVEGTIPDSVLVPLQRLPEGDVLLPQSVRQYLQVEFDVDVPNELGQWDGVEFYFVEAKPGADTWIAIDSEFSEFIYESTKRGWVAYFNDLHKGRDTGLAWRIFIDAFSVVCIVFCVTGLILLFRQSSHRASTWPITTLGVLIPLVIILIFI